MSKNQTHIKVSAKPNKPIAAHPSCSKSRQKAVKAVKPLTTQIYALCDPRDNSVRYIGKANVAQKRFKQHLLETRRDYPVYRWINKLRSIGLIPIMRVIREINKCDWKAIEIEEIAAARAAGMKLLNVADGGDQPFCSKEIRAENGRRNAIARVNTPIKAMAFDLKRKIGMMLVRGELKDRHIEKMRIAAHKCPELFGAWAAL